MVLSVSVRYVLMPFVFRSAGVICLDLVGVARMGLMCNALRCASLLSCGSIWFVSVCLSNQKRSIDLHVLCTDSIIWLLRRINRLTVNLNWVV